MIVYRLSRKKHKAVLSGKGASIHGGRWNRKGTEAIYTSSSRALAMAEILVHLPLQHLPTDYFMLMVYIPDSVGIYHLPEDILPVHWNSFPYNRRTQDIGHEVMQKGKYGVFRLPSAVVKGDFNFLIDPLHPDCQKIRLIDEEPFPFDNRLVFGS